MPAVTRPRCCGSHPNGSLRLVPGGVTSSGGVLPVSVAIHGDLVFVANAGDGGSNYTGLVLQPSGRLAPVAGSTLTLPGGSQPGDVLFNGDGTKLAGTRVGTSLIDSFTVGSGSHLTAAPGPGRHGRRAAGRVPRWPGAGRDRASLRLLRAAWHWLGRGRHGVRADPGGKKPQWPGRLDQPHTFQFLPDIACGLLVLAGHREADGQVWHLPAAEPLTAQQFFDMVAERAGRPMPVQASVVSPALLAVAGMFSPLLREMRETACQFRAPFVIDSSRFDAAFGRLEPTPHSEEVAQTVAWYRSADPAPAAAHGRLTDSAPHPAGGAVWRNGTRVRSLHRPPGTPRPGAVA